MRKPVELIKREIATQAGALFIQRGYAATSMEEICRATGRSKGSIYYHFKSKEELFLHVIKLKAEAWNESWSLKEGQCSTAVEKLYALAEHFADDFENPLMGVANEFMTSQIIDEDMMNELLGMLRSSYHLYEKVLEEGIQRGELLEDNARDLMYILHGMLGGLGTLYYETDINEIKRLHIKSIDVFLNGVRAR